MDDKRFTTYKLQFPVEYGDEVITELKIRRPRGKELKLMPMDTPKDFQLSHEIAATLCGQPPQLLDILEKPDWMAVIRMANDFLSPTENSSDGPPSA